MLDESLHYLRRFFNGIENRGCLHGLFCDGNANQGIVVGRNDVTLQFQVPQEFYTPLYDEPLACAHARGKAFGGSSITFDAPVPADLPERCLLSNRAHPAEYRRDSIRLRWLLETVFEVPQFCVGVALTQHWRVDNNWLANGDSLELLKAATQIKPNAFDVVGVYTTDANLQGAVEFVEHVADDVYIGHLVAATQQDRQLRDGDQLFNRYSALIGGTTITAERCLFEVIEVGEQAIPPVPDFCNEA